MKKAQGGFTLIELLVVMAIIGILAAIAIPQFTEYRKKAYDAAAKSDLRNVATAEEAYFVDNGAYVAVTESNVASTLKVNLSDATHSKLSLTLGTTASGGPKFTGSSYDDRGSLSCNWDSENGGLTGCSAR